MNAIQPHTLSGIALPQDAQRMLNEICEHFIEHAEVQRSEGHAVLKGEDGTADIRLRGKELLIDLACGSLTALQMHRTMIAEHLFYFAGDEPFELNWAEPSLFTALPNLHEVTVVSTQEVTPHMRRVTFSCADLTPFIAGDMHVRLLVPPKGKAPVWPGYRADGRIAWPEGEDELLVRVYTIRGVDLERGELWIDFVQHPALGVKTPGADFARDARPGDVAALVGPGAGGLPDARSILMIGDETALPAIARIAAEVPQGTHLKAIVEVLDEAEEQPLPSNGSLEIRWLHRKDHAGGAKRIFAEEAKKAIASAVDGTFIWVACEKEDVRLIRAFLRSRRHDRKAMYVAWFWERFAG